MQLVLEGFCINYDKYDRLHIMFLSSYDPEITFDETKNRIKQLVKKKYNIKLPITDNRFIVKCNKNPVLNKCIDIDNNRITPRELKSHLVKVTVKVQYYKIPDADIEGISFNLIHASIK